jgi:hypothetical protein
MSGFITKSFESPDETRTPDKTTVEVVDLAGIKAARLTAAPGWKWSYRLRRCGVTMSRIFTTSTRSSSSNRAANHNARPKAALSWRSKIRT